MGGKVPYAIVTQMDYNPIDKTLRVGTFGRGIWKMKLPSDETCEPNKQLNSGR
jgi:hypothetical protein